jgi:caffeoyl-CoA O-methyltransferase
MERRGATFRAVPVVAGRWIRVLTEAAAARHVVEVGTSTGYSGLWIALALMGTGGRLTTFESDARRAETARGYFGQAGVEDRITLVVGDAHKKIGSVSGPVDVVFLDADKDGYPDYLAQLEPMVRPGGLILAHNVTSSPEYVDAITSDPRFETVFQMAGNELSVTLKKR